MNQAFSSAKFIWLGRRNDSSSEYIGDHVTKWGADPAVLLSSSLQNFLLAGVDNDQESSQASALRYLRQYLNPLAWPLDENQHLFDAGDLLEWSNPDMRDTVVAELISQAFREDVRSLLMQTHSAANYGFFAGANLANFGSKDPTSLGYIRISPSLLTLSSRAGEPSVGSAMSKLSKRLGHTFQCLQLGVQEAINPKEAWINAAGLGINALTLAACEPELLLLYLSNFCKSLDSVLISVDLDVLSEPVAPGSHRSTAFGLSLEVLMPALRWIAGEGKLLGVELTGIGTEEYQKALRPRLAASITQDLLSHWF